jgi:cytidyltransferase-like protein
VQRQLARLVSVHAGIADWRGLRVLDVGGGDGHRLPFGFGTFHLVVLYDVLEHVRRPAAVLEQVASVLRPGGVAYVTVPNRLSPVNMLSDPHYNVPMVGVLPRRLGAWCVTRLLRLAPDFTVERDFTWWGLTRLFREAGLEWRALPPGSVTKLAAGVRPNAPARRWMARVARLPLVRSREGGRLLDLTGARIAAVTLDADGALFFERGRPPYRTYAEPADHARTAGAGDTFAGALALAAGGDVPAAAELASAAAAVVVGKPGTATCSAAELRARLALGDKFCPDAATLLARLAVHREQGRRIVFANGCLDILHRGHVTSLSAAKALGDVLVVALNTDAGVRRLKGPGRPINPLAVWLDAIGDVLMTTPALRALKSARPGRHLTLLTSRAGGAAAALVPEVDAVIPYDPPWMKATPERTSASLEYALARRLAAEGFEAAVIFTVYSQSPLPAALLLWLAGVPLRLAHCRENPYQLLTDWVPDPEPARFVRHEVRRQLDLVSAVGATAPDERLSLRVPAAARERVRALLDGLGLSGRPWVLLHPGATAPSRRSPPDSFAEVVRGLGAAGLPVVLARGAEDGARVAAIRRAAPSAASLAGRLDFGELAALIGEARCSSPTTARRSPSRPPSAPRSSTSTPSPTPSTRPGASRTASSSTTSPASTATRACARRATTPVCAVSVPPRWSRLRSRSWPSGDGVRPEARRRHRACSPARSCAALADRAGVRHCPVQRAAAAPGLYRRPEERGPWPFSSKASRTGPSGA